MKLSVRRQGDKLDAAMARDGLAVIAAARDGTKDEAERVKATVRGLVAAAFERKGGRNPANAIRSKYYDRDQAGRDNPGAIVFSRLGRREGGRFVDYLLPHVKGLTQQARITPGAANDKGLYMLLPVRGVSRRVSALKRALSQLGTDPQLELIPIAGGRYLFVRRTTATTKSGGWRKGARDTVLGVLVRRVKLKASIRIDEGIERDSVDRLAKHILTAVGE